MKPTICEAIEGLKVIRFSYEGRERYVEPHCYGICTSGKEMLHAYQIKGQSKSGGLPDWRNFYPSGMKKLHITEQNFAGPRPDYNPHNTKDCRNNLLA